MKLVIHVSLLVEGLCNEINIHGILYMLALTSYSFKTLSSPHLKQCRVHLEAFIEAVVWNVHDLFGELALSLYECSKIDNPPSPQKHTFVIIPL